MMTNTSRTLSRFTQSLTVELTKLPVISYGTNKNYYDEMGKHSTISIEKSIVISFIESDIFKK